MDVYTVGTEEAASLPAGPQPTHLTTYEHGYFCVRFRCPGVRAFLVKGGDDSAPPEPGSRSLLGPPS
jgi:hypothetical protein